jgi:hypothetical protein
MSKWYVGDVGRTITVALGIDLTPMTVKEILVIKPNGQFVEWPGTILGDAKNGIIIYTTVYGDLNCSGVWRAQGKVENAAGTIKKKGETFTFTIYDRFK